MSPVRQNPIPRTVRTAHLSVLMTVHSFSTNIGVARGAVGAPAPPRVVKKNLFRRNLQGKCVNAPTRTRSAPPSQSKSQIFRTVFAGRLDLEVYVDGL